MQIDIRDRDAFTSPEEGYERAEKTLARAFEELEKAHSAYAAVMSAAADDPQTCRSAALENVKRLADVPPSELDDEERDELKKQADSVMPAGRLRHLFKSGLAYEDAEASDFPCGITDLTVEFVSPLSYDMLSRILFVCDSIFLPAGWTLELKAGDGEPEPDGLRYELNLSCEAKVSDDVRPIRRADDVARCAGLPAAPSKKPDAIANLIVAKAMFEVQLSLLETAAGLMRGLSDAKESGDDAAIAALQGAITRLWTEGQAADVARTLRPWGQFEKLTDIVETADSVLDSFDSAVCAVKSHTKSVTFSVVTDFTPEASDLWIRSWWEPVRLRLDTKQHWHVADVKCQRTIPGRRNRFLIAVTLEGSGERIRIVPPKFG